MGQAWKERQRQFEQGFLATLRANPDMKARDLFFAHFWDKRAKSANPAVRQFDAFAEENLALNQELAELLAIAPKPQLAAFNPEERHKISRLVRLAKRLSRYFRVPTKGRDYFNV